MTLKKLGRVARQLQLIPRRCSKSDYVRVGTLKGKTRGKVLQNLAVRRHLLESSSIENPRSSNGSSPQNGGSYPVAHDQRHTQIVSDWIPLLGITTTQLVGEIPKRLQDPPDCSAVRSGSPKPSEANLSLKKGALITGTHKGER